MVVSYGDSGSWTYRVNARTNGVVDLSGLSQLTAPGQDDWLEFNVDSGGLLKLDNLRRITGHTRFNVGVPLLEFPLLESTADTHFTLAPNSRVRFLSLVSDANAGFNVGQNATVDAPSLVAMDNVSLSLSNNSAFIATNLSVYRNSDIPIMPGRNFQPGPLADNLCLARLGERRGDAPRGGAGL